MNFSYQNIKKSRWILGIYENNFLLTDYVNFIYVVLTSAMCKIKQSCNDESFPMVIKVDYCYVFQDLKYYRLTGENALRSAGDGAGWLGEVHLLCGSCRARAGLSSSGLPTNLILF